MFITVVHLAFECLHVEDSLCDPSITKLTVAFLSSFYLHRSTEAPCHQLQLLDKSLQSRKIALLGALSGHASGELESEAALLSSTSKFLGLLF